MFFVCFYSYLLSFLYFSFNRRNMSRIITLTLISWRVNNSKFRALFPSPPQVPSPHRHKSPSLCSAPILIKIAFFFLFSVSLPSVLLATFHSNYLPPSAFFLLPSFATLCSIRFSLCLLPSLLPSPLVTRVRWNFSRGVKWGLCEGGVDWVKVE